MDSSTSDIQELYRSHVHEKRILKGNMHALEKQTVKTLKNLSAESRQFKNKFSKYIKGRRSNSIHDLPLGMKSTPESESNRPMSRDMVCNECPYSFETWNNLVDVDREGIDCYKSEILFGDSKSNRPISEIHPKEHSTPVQSGMVTEIPGFRRNLNNASRLSVSASALVGRAGNSPGASPRSPRRVIADLRKSPSTSRKTHELSVSVTASGGRREKSPGPSPRSPRSPRALAHQGKSPTITKKTHEATITDCETLKMNKSKTKTELPTVRVAGVEDIHLPRIGSVGKGMDSVDEPGTFGERVYRRRSHTIDNHVKPNLASVGEGKDIDSIDELDTFDEEFHRGRSHTIDNHVKPVLLKRRKRLDNQLNDYPERRPSFATVTLKVMADAAKGKNKLKYLTRLVQDLPLSGYDKCLVENELKENKSWADIYETLKKCRYLRSPPISRRGSVELTDEERYKWA